MKIVQIINKDRKINVSLGSQHLDQLISFRPCTTGRLTMMDQGDRILEKTI